MISGHKIVRAVLDKFRGLPVRLQSITEKSDEWFASHGREPKTRNPLSSGNLSPVDTFLKFAMQYEAAMSGAGKMLNQRVYSELCAELGKDCAEHKQTDLHTQILKEAFDVLKCLNQSQFETLSSAELARIEEECCELRDVASDAVAHARAVKRLKQINI